MIKIGDKVKVIDNSYSLKITDEGLHHKFGYPGGCRNEESPVYKVLDTKLVLPSDDEYERNDTIIQHKNDIYFVQESLLKPIKKFVKYYNSLENVIDKIINDKVDSVYFKNCAVSGPPEEGFEKLTGVYSLDFVYKQWCNDNIYIKKGE